MARRRGAAGAAVLLAAFAVVGFFSVVGAAAAGDSTAVPGVAVAVQQTSPSSSSDVGGSTTSVTTSRNVLDGTPTSAAPTSTAVSAGVQGASGGKAKGSVNYKIWAVVAGLVLIAVLIAWWTVRYWRATDPRGARAPSRQDRLRERDQPRRGGRSDGPRDRPGDRPPPRSGGEPGPRKRSRYSDLVITLPNPEDPDE